MILIIDNYDSFTYNLYQYVGEFTSNLLVKRNDEISIEEINTLQPQAIIFSPGPGMPKDAGCMEDIIRVFHKQIPMLGICLGHQAIGEVFHGTIASAEEKVHGEARIIQICDDNCLFQGLSKQIMTGRYHSLIVKQPDSELVVTAISEQQEIMALRHKNYPVYGVQFHPESLLTPDGKTILHNFIKTLKKETIIC